MQVRNLEADVLHWQEMYQDSLRKARSPGQAEPPVSRASSHSAPLPEPSSSPTPSRGVVIAADESPPAEHDDLYGLIG